ncbi:hypothetical protein SKAU_G00391760 [Synaphobranchus kaupii]|uniref:Uncharacterized protein n=1 Tax=Synaphobranchus kaupii TaxID=118154 RepID=A0A9Q1IDP0_SYNKA|nr:hypothetical protein SKAU_G00391760 [Synaphobranchus kaupii]
MSCGGRAGARRLPKAARDATGSSGNPNNSTGVTQAQDPNSAGRFTVTATPPSSKIAREVLTVRLLSTWSILRARLAGGGPGRAIERFGGRPTS